ncbi:MAG: 2Fe-2S iron-sulfur cluster-binding protein [Alphaproteobacteria bacterium]
MPVLRIAGHDRPIPLDPDRTLLDAALDAGAALPFGCKSGICGACRVAVLAGSVSHGPHSAAALTAGERAAGMALACRARATGDVAIAAAGTEPPPPRPRRFTTAVRSVARLGRSSVALTLEPPPGGLAWLAGQYATLGLGDRAPRDFSLASLPGDRALVFHIRDAGPGTAGAGARGLSPGDRVTAEGPFGRAHFSQSQRGPLLLVAGGTGLGAMLATARAALAALPARRVVLCAGAADAGELYGTDQLDRLAERFPAFAWHAITDDAGSAVDLARAEMARGTDGLAVHAAGPPAMVAALVAAAEGAGIPPAMIRADAFRPVTPSA